MLRFLVRETLEFLLRKALMAMVRGAAANLLPGRPFRAYDFGLGRLRLG